MHVIKKATKSKVLEPELEPVTQQGGGEIKWSHAPRCESLLGASTDFFSHLKMCFNPRLHKVFFVDLLNVNKQSSTNLSTSISNTVRGISKLISHYCAKFISDFGNGFRKQNHT